MIENHSLDFSFRKATRDDAAFIGLIIAEAVEICVMEEYEAGKIDENKDLLKSLISITSEDDTLYSWRNCILAETSEGKLVGGLVSYPGEGYLERRNLTFQKVKHLIDFDVEKMDAETKDGEYYLDSLAILPAYRKQGLGCALLQQGLEKAKTLHRPAVLACAPENTEAKHLYESLGFHEEGHLFIFGEDYLRMVCRQE